VTGRHWRWRFQWSPVATASGAVPYSGRYQRNIVSADNSISAVDRYFQTLRRNDYVSSDDAIVYDVHDDKRYYGVYCSKDWAVQVQKYSSGHCILQERVEVPQGRQKQKHNLGLCDKDLRDHLIA
jgi:hypothetical protein